MGKKPTPASKSGRTTPKQPRAPRRSERNGDSDDIERAVYDGMQDLRAAKPKK